MAQTTIMAAATTVGTTSSDITVGAGWAVTIGLFVASGTPPTGASFPIYAATPGPGADLVVGTLTAQNPTHVFEGPGTYRVVRNSAAVMSGTTVATGVYMEASTGGALPVTPGGSGASADQVQGNAANDAVAAGNPVRIGFTAETTEMTAVADGDAVNAVADIAGKQIIMPYATAGQNWHYVAAASGIVNGTAVTIKTAGAAGIKNKITSVDLSWSALGTGGEIAIRDGVAGPVIWRQNIIAGAAGDRSILLPTPLEGSAATLLEIILLTAPVSGAVYANVHGFMSAA